MKRDDHLMDATRYLIISGSCRIRTKPHPNQASTQASWRRCDVVVRARLNRKESGKIVKRGDHLTELVVASDLIPPRRRRR